MNLRNLRVIAFVSFPSRELQESNPEAYQGAVSSIFAQYPNAGTCAHCGMGIIHNVICKTPEGAEVCIGTQCAERIGADPRAVRAGITSEERERRDARQEALAAEHRAEVAEREARVAGRREKFADILAGLADRAVADRDTYNPNRETFAESLANQLVERPLSPRQAFFVAKMLSDTGRRNKKNAATWDEIENRVQS